VKRPSNSAIVLGLLSLIFFGAFGPIAAFRPLWYDEIFTLMVSTLPSMGEVLRALHAAVDMQLPCSSPSVAPQ